MRITAAPKPSGELAPLAVTLSAVWKTKARQAGYSRVLFVLWKFEFLKLCNHEKPLNATPYPRRAPKRVRRAAQAELGTICG